MYVYWRNSVTQRQNIYLSLIIQLCFSQTEGFLVLQYLAFYREKRLETDRQMNSNFINIDFLYKNDNIMNPCDKFSKRYPKWSLLLLHKLGYYLPSYLGIDVIQVYSNI